MKKPATFLMMVLMALAPVKANAVVPAPLFPPAFPLVAGASFTGGSLAVAATTTVLPIALFALGAENVDPWTPVFGKDHVFSAVGDYPAGANHVFVQAQKVNYTPVSENHGPYHVVSKFGTDSIRSD